MSIAHQVKPGPLYAGTKPARDPEYRRFIKRLPCVACLRTWWIDPCHTGPHGTGQKSCDYSCIPLCRRHHDEYDAGPQAFAEKHGLDIPALIELFNSFYRTQFPERKPITSERSTPQGEKETA